MSKKFCNAPNTIVNEALQGLVSCNSHLSFVQGFPNIKVVYNVQHDKSKVALISGGGSGHEPAHAGYVGNGMLSAAVCGDVFASPSSEAVLAAINTVTGPAGCLLIIKNYTGDRLHFGLAAEQARAEGLKVEIVAVGEDVAIAEPGLAGRRGLAGTVLVHKIAGALAASGASLAEVAGTARAAAENMITLGVASRVCSLPGKEPSRNLNPDEIEVGLGIHGEPGHEKMQSMPLDELVDRMMRTLVGSSFAKLADGDSVVLLVNNLGGTSALEILGITVSALKWLQQNSKVIVTRAFSGYYMTSLDMAGFSLTLLNLSAITAGGAGRTAAQLLQLLDLPVAAVGWTPGCEPQLDKPEVAAPGCALEQEKTSVSGGGGDAENWSSVLELCVRAACSAILGAAAELDELDSKVGDGDCGATLAAMASAVLAAISTGTLPLHHPSATLASLAQLVLRSGGGTSGALYALGLTAAGGQWRAAVEPAAGTAAAQPAAAATAGRWAIALEAATEAISSAGGAKPGCRTIVDALVPAAEEMRSALSAKGSSSFSSVAHAAAGGAARGAEATASMTAAAGRASYVPAALAQSVPDPGAVAVKVWTRAIADALAISGY